MFMTAIITVIAAYLLGSVNFAIIFTKTFLKKDVREIGSGNAGATNAYRAGGALTGLLTFFCDLLKGLLSSVIGLLVFSYIYKKTGSAVYLPIYGAYYCGVAAIIGHIFPLFFEFKGGKGVSTGLGVFIICCPLAAVIGFAVFVIVFFLTKIVSFSSLSGTLVLFICSLVFFSKTNGAAFLPQAICSFIICAIIFIKHKSNIKRLLNGEETKIKLRR